MSEYKTIEVQKIPLNTRELKSFIEKEANKIAEKYFLTKDPITYEIVSFESFNMKNRGNRGYKVIFLLRKIYSY